jgi:hypothetical protein
MASHFLFVAGALRERSARESADVQLAHRIWGLRSELIRDNAQRYLSAGSCGLVYVLKEGLCAHCSIASGVQPPDRLDALVRDELRTEARHGYVAVSDIRPWRSSPAHSLANLKRILEVPDQAELTRRLNLGMHRLTQDQHDALVKAVEGVS